MNTRRDETNAAALEAVDCSPRTLRALTAARRRAVVSTLLEHDEPLTLDRLASHVDERLDADEGAHAGEDADDLAVSLGHVHVPVLRETDLASVETDPWRVAAGSNPDLRDGPVSQPLLAGVDDEAWTALDALRRDPGRPAVLTSLDGTGSAVTVDDLTDRLTDSPPEREPAVPPASVDEVALRHHHLPELDAVDLVSYDAAAGVVSTDPDPSLPLPSLVDAVQRSFDGGYDASLATDGGRPRDGTHPPSRTRPRNADSGER